MVYGDALDALFGTLAPTPAERIETVEETGVVDLGDGRRLDSHYSPGHAKHHVGLLDSASGDLYVGDAAGVYLPETGDLRAATPPPDFDLDVALASLRLFGALRPERLLFSHYGPLGEVAQTLERSAEEIKVWVEETRKAHRAGLDLDHAVAMVHERTKDRYKGLRDVDDKTAGDGGGRSAGRGAGEKLMELTGTRANVSGIMHWLDKTGDDARYS
jgi:glyoxylase-like metal-dependent hydrolase (beta-lactamase superfamily II)